ncbi:hypothetical protein SCHPADRAFT_934414 [Schizopora paradoxa]|uniref:ABM domain-containing protein n=1 Tax=Schizopora paradoxa TaxID=27342 RepID=A0A0H2SFJ4_9AGAM|nr:hypothetical protein SCHPADRAFT_934414 [Schizopora paradoxa]
MSLSPEGFTGEIVALAKLQAKPGCEEKLIEHCVAINKIANSDDEPGCLTYRVVQSGSHVVVFEKYKDQVALKQHLETQAFKDFATAAGDILVEKPAVTFYEELF